MTDRISLFDVSMLVKITEFDFLIKFNYIFTDKHIGAFVLKLIILIIFLLF